MTCVSSCAANIIECEGVVYSCETVRDLVLVAIGSFRFWIAWMDGWFADFMIDLVRLAIGSWSPLEFIATCVFFGTGSNYCSTTPLEVMAVCFSWSPLELGVGYRTGATSCLGMIGVECGNAVCALGGKYSSVRQFANIVCTASIAANCEFHMLVGTSLSADDNSVWRGSFCILPSRGAA